MESYMIIALAFAAGVVVMTMIVGWPVVWYVINGTLEQFSWYWNLKQRIRRWKAKNYATVPFSRFIQLLISVGSDDSESYDALRKNLDCWIPKKHFSLIWRILYINGNHDFFQRYWDMFEHQVNPSDILLNDLFVSKEEVHRYLLSHHIFVNDQAVMIQWGSSHHHDTDWGRIKMIEDLLKASKFEKLDQFLELIVAKNEGRIAGKLIERKIVSMEEIQSKIGDNKSFRIQ